MTRERARYASERELAPQFACRWGLLLLALFQLHSTRMSVHHSLISACAVCAGIRGLRCGTRVACLPPFIHFIPFHMDFPSTNCRKISWLDSITHADCNCNCNCRSNLDQMRWTRNGRPKIGDLRSAIWDLRPLALHGQVEPMANQWLRKRYSLTCS